MTDPTQRPAQSDARDAAASSVVPSVDLGAGFEAVGFVPGRYAVLVERNMSGLHARDRLTFQSSASFVVELGGEGVATACYGQKLANVVDRPAGQQVQEFRIQQGFRGTYVLRDGEVEAALTPDDSICAEVRSGNAPAHRAVMTLRCIQARSIVHTQLAEPLLLCDWREADWFAYYPLAADGVAPARWIILGSGNGVRARVTGRTVSSTSGPPVKVTIERASERIEANAWDRSFPAPELDDGL